jgi:hypothetical protein
MKVKIQCLHWVVVGRMSERVIVICLEKKHFIRVTQQGGSTFASDVVILAMLLENAWLICPRKSKTV